MILSVRSDRLIEVFRIAQRNCDDDNRTILLESDVVLAVLSIPKSVVGITCCKLGLSTDILIDAISKNFYPQIPYSDRIERLAIEHFSKLPGVLEMALPEHILFVLCRTSGFTECLRQLGIDPDQFIRELYKRSGKDIELFPNTSEWVKSLQRGAN